MPPRDKYTVFTRHERGYRKGIHKVPKWTRVSNTTRLPSFGVINSLNHTVDFADKSQRFLSCTQCITVFYITWDFGISQ